MLPYTFTAPVVAGHGNGDKLNAPTANFDLSFATSLQRGLYTCTAAMNDQTFNGLLYYGHNSLTGTDCFEVHLLNFSGNLYEKKITVTVDRYIRQEKKFTDEASLKAQIATDLSTAADYFSKK